MSKRLIYPIKAILVDLSGTIHIENKVTPNAVEALSQLRKTGLKLKFVTNTTKEDLNTLYLRLARLGFDIEKHEIYSSLIAARDLVRNLDVRPFLMLSPDAKLDFAEFDTKDPNAVIVGLSPEHFCYDKMNEAFHLLQKGSHLIAIHKARYYQRSVGLSLGPGPFVQALEFATEMKAIVVGKPEKQFFLGAAKSLDVSAASCVMIGDDARDDIGGAISAGMQGILVRTGKYRNGDELKIISSFCMADTFYDAVQIIIDSIMKND